MSIDARLAELGITLPQAAAPVAAYVPTVEANGLLHISGQIALAPDGLMTGRLGEDRDLDYGVAAAYAVLIMAISLAMTVVYLKVIKVDPERLP